MSDGRSMTDAEFVTKTADELQVLAHELEGLSFMVPGLKDRVQKLSSTARSLHRVGGRMRAAQVGGDDDRR